MLIKVCLSRTIEVIDDPKKKKTKEEENEVRQPLQVCFSCSCSLGLLLNGNRSAFNYEPLTHKIIIMTIILLI